MDASACLATLVADGCTYRYYSLAAAERRGFGPTARLPVTLKILLENALRHHTRSCADVRALVGRDHAAHVTFRPARVMMDDTAGLPLIGELAAMRDAAKQRGCDAGVIDLALPLDFVVDHSVSADYTGVADAVERNMALEMKRNVERFQLLRWAEQAFRGLRIVPPGKGIAHQINLEHLAHVVCVEHTDDGALAYPDTVLGIDSHTPMINGLGVVAWGTSGIEGLAAALGQPVSVQVPRIVGCRLTGALAPGATATDLVLTLTRKLREFGVVGKFVEYYGPGVSALTVPDRATVANMTPEAGATLSYFPIDAATVQYLRATGRSAAHAMLVEAYAKEQGLWHEPHGTPCAYDEHVTFDLAQVEPSLAGPRLPHQRVSLATVPQVFTREAGSRRVHSEAEGSLQDGDVVLAAITSCTNTSNPALMVGAGLLARNAARRGIEVQPWVKTSFSPGSRVVADYLKNSGLQAALDGLGFHVAGYGCMTCVGFSGPLSDDIVSAVRDDGVRVAAVYSGNRNYEGRAHPLIRSSFLASPPLVVAYALCGTILRDLTREPLGRDTTGGDVFLADIWPDPLEVQEILGAHLKPDLFSQSYENLCVGTSDWQALEYPRGPQFAWRRDSSFIRRPRTYADDPPAPLADLHGARILASYGDMVTTEHLSPMSAIPDGSPAAAYLESLGIAVENFVSYAARRLNHDVMARGALSSPHLVNELVPDKPGGLTRHMPSGTLMTIYDAAQRYGHDAVPLILIAGRSLGAGSSRDWSAKGLTALGVRIVIAESYERIYRSNLVAAGVLPLCFPDGTSRKSLGLDGSESVDVTGLAALAPGATVSARFMRDDGRCVVSPLRAQLSTDEEIDWLRHGGLLACVLQRLTGMGGTAHREPS